MSEEPNEPSTSLEASIKARMAERESEIWLASRLLAGVIGAAILWRFAYFRDVTQLGPHSVSLAGGIGFVVGAFMGKRIVFMAIGILLAYFLLPCSCG